MLKSVLLDIDGTLLLSNDAHAQAWVEALEEYGYTIPFERIQPLIGMGGDKLLAKIIPGLSDSHGLGKEIAEQRKKIFLEKYAPTLQPAPGGRDLVLRIREDHLQPVIATSAKSEELEALLEAAQIADLVEDQVTSDDASESKPDPDIVQAAVEKSGVEADETIMIGDTPYDIESAKKIEVGVIAVRCGGHDHDLAGALAVYDDPADLLAHYDESPLARETVKAR